MSEGTKSFKEIKVIKEKHQLKLTKKTEKGELTLAQFEQNLEMAAGRIFRTFDSCSQNI